MFSGIIQSVGVVKSACMRGGGRVYAIELRTRSRVKNGDSVMISGICSTVTGVQGKLATFFHMPETLAKTTSGSWQPGARVNIETSLRVGDTISGHFVFGHIDGVATVEKIEKKGDSRLFWFRAPQGMQKFLVPKGSVALDGVSLTVVQVKGDRFSVSMIPFTLSHTTLGTRRIGDHINFEADMLAKYLEKLIK